MGKHKGGSLRQRLHRGRIKTKLHWERTFHTGANMPAVRSIRQLIHKILGLLIGVPVFVVLYDLLKKLIYWSLRHRGQDRMVSEYESTYHPPEKQKQKKKMRMPINQKTTE